MPKSQSSYHFLSRGLTSEGGSLNCAVRHGSSFGGCVVRLLGVSSLNSGRAQVRPFFFVRAPRMAPFAGQRLVGRDLGKRGDLAIDWREVRPGCREQLRKVVDDEIRVLI